MNFTVLLSGEGVTANVPPTNGEAHFLLFLLVPVLVFAVTAVAAAFDKGN